MMIKVKTLTGKEIEVDIDGTDKIERIKERVEEKEGRIDYEGNFRLNCFVFLRFRYSSTTTTANFRWETNDGR